MNGAPLRLLLQAGGPLESKVEEVQWLGGLAAWVFFLLIVPVVVFYVVFVYRREKISGKASGRWLSGRWLSGRWLSGRGLLAGLRVLVILAVIAMLAEPVLRTTKFLDQPSVVLVLLDDSLSMDIADKYSNRELVDKISEFFNSTPDTIEETKRYDLVRRLFRSDDIGLLEKLRRKGKVVIYSFAGGIQRLKEVPKRQEGDPPLPPEEREVLPPYEELRSQERVRQTRLADAILDAVSGVRGGSFAGASVPIAGIVLITDGQQTAGSRSPADIARRLGQRNIPVYTIGVGNPDEAKDIRVVSLEANEVVLAGDRVPFDAVLVADGYEGERVRVDLKFDGAVVDTRYFVLEGDGRRQSVRLEYRPPKPGDFVATVEVEHRSGELFAENNVLSKPVRVLEQRIRVLYAEGRPRWEYRYLKNALIRDKTMDAQVYLFSADPEFVQESSPGTPPLRRFPQTREELFQYHVIVLGDVDFEREVAEQKVSESEISLLKEFVYDAGGGIVFIAGINANPSKYLHTDLYSLLPVEVPEPMGLARGADQSPITSSFNVQLTAVGKEHSVMRLDSDVDRNLQLWEEKDGQFFDHLPGFFWLADVGREKKGAVVLARHPEKVHPLDQKGLVVFAFMNYGKGRTFFSAVEETWRWRAGVDNRYFYRFWGQVVRFSASGRLLGKTPRFSISTDKTRYALGETVNIECRVFDADMKPATDKTLTVYRQARGAGGEVAEKLELGLDPVRGQGTYHGAIAADRVGVHDLWLGSETDRLAFRSFEVEVPALEMRDPRRNQPVLKEIAENSGGKNFELYEVPRMVEMLEAMTQSQQGDIEDNALWDEVWVLLAITGILAAEWILRKVARLL